MPSQSQAALPAGADASEGPARPRVRRTSGQSGCYATCHTRLAQIVALLEAQTVRAMPGHIPLTPAAYLEGLYQAAAERAHRGGLSAAQAP